MLYALIPHGHVVSRLFGLRASVDLATTALLLKKDFVGLGQANRGGSPL